MKVRIGVIGVGTQGMAHVRSILPLEHAEITTVYDANAEIARRAASETGAKIASSSDELLDRNLIDAVIVCSPQFSREGLEETAAQRGIHLLVEKPVGLDLQLVRQKCKEIDKSGVIHASGHCLRYLDTVLQAKQYLVGKPIHLVQINRVGSAKGWPNWMRQQHLSGGNMVAGVTHQIDLVRFICGEFSQIGAHFNRMSHPNKNPEDTLIDSGAASFVMENGSVGTIGESTASEYYDDAEIKIVGYDFYLQLDQNGSKLLIRDKDGLTTQTSKLNAMIEQSKCFVDAVAARSQHIVLSSYIDAARTLAVTLGSLESAEQQRMIQLNYEGI